MTIASPTIINYAVDQKWSPVDGGTGRLIGLQPFVPPPVKTGRDCWRPINTAEWAAYWLNVLSNTIATAPNGVQNVEASWVAQVVAGDSVINGGIMYRCGNTFLIWTGTSWTVAWPVRAQVVPDWLTQPKLNNEQ